MNNRYPKEAVNVKQIGGNWWQFEYPRLSLDVLEEFHEAIDLWRMGYVDEAEDAYRRLIVEFPEFIDACHHLALLLNETGRQEGAFRVWKRAVNLGLSCLPEAFDMEQDELPWGILENRPFLRAYHGLALQYLERGDEAQALEMFENLLSMNPNDNQGVRALVINLYLQQKRPEDALALSRRYPDDAMEQTLYGRALALYQLGRKREATEALCAAIDLLPLVGKELTKTRHTRPESMHPDRITVGGEDQAYFFWREQGQYWEETPGAIAWVKSCLQRLENE